MTPLERYTASEPIHTLFPQTLGNGEVVKSFTVRCCMCDTEFDPDHMRGDIVRKAGAVIVRSVNRCYTCRTMTYSYVHIIPHMDTYKLEYPASYPVRVPWKEDERDWARLTDGLPPETMPGDWVNIADHMLRSSAKH